MLFGAGMIPNYIIFAKYYKLADSIWIYILPGITGGAWNTMEEGVVTPSVSKASAAAKPAKQRPGSGAQAMLLRDIPEDAADVVVCDGFVGNTILKQTEGFYELARMRGINDDYIDKLNYEFVGGTAVLGINAVVLIGHGRSSALAIQNMVRQTEKTVKSGLVNKLQDTFRNF